MTKQRKQQKGILVPYLAISLVCWVYSKELFALFIGLGILACTVYIAVKLQQRNHLRRSNIQEIDAMTGPEFENYLGELFRSLGYQTRVTKGSGDFGADLVLEKDGERIVIQAKRYKKSVGISAVQEIVAARSYYQAEKMWVVTNSSFTEAARTLAQANGVVLMDRQKLIQLSIQANRGKLRATV